MWLQKRSKRVAAVERMQHKTSSPLFRCCCLRVWRDTDGKSGDAFVAVFFSDEIAYASDISSTFTRKVQVHSFPLTMAKCTYRYPSRNKPVSLYLSLFVM